MGRGRQAEPVRKWTTRELRYLNDHASDGAAKVSHALNRSLGSVRMKAHEQGISLRRWWTCPKCGHRTTQPLVGSTGWCRNCTREERRREMAEAVRELEDQAKRAAEEERKRQALYARKSRAKKKAELPKQKAKNGS